LVIAYLLVLILCFGVLVPAAIMLDSQSGIVAQVLHYTRALSPLAAELSLLRPNMSDGDFAGRTKNLFSSWEVFVPLSIVIVTVCSLLVIERLRKPPTSSEGYGATPGGSEEERSLGRKMMFLIDPKKKRKPFGTFNPLIAKEARTNSLRSGPWMIRIFYGSVFLSLGLAVMSIYGGTQYPDMLKYVAQVLITFQIGVVALISPSLTSSAISSEIENGTFETLRMSRLSPGKIFWGKFIPAFLPAILPIIALVPAYAAVCYVKTEYIARLQFALPIIFLAVVFCCTLGLTCSSLINNTARATVASYMITAGIFVLPLFGWWALNDGLFPQGHWVAFISPLVMALNQLPESSSKIVALRREHLIVIGSLCVVLLVIARLRLGLLLRQG
jgi:hypothetical protein